MIKTVFFDWGGVIATDAGDDFLFNLLKGIGATDDQVKEILSTYMPDLTRGAISESTFWDQLRSTYGFSIDESISDEFKNWTGLIANEKVLKLVAEVKSRGIKVVVFTNVIEPSYNLIEKAGYYALFDDVIASCKVGYGKPEKEIYEIALERLNATPNESLFIDDKQVFLDPATALGMHTILATDPDQLIRQTLQLLDN